MTRINFLERIWMSFDTIVMAGSELAILILVHVHVHAHLNKLLKEVK